MMLSCLFSCFYHIKQFKAYFYLTFLNFFYCNGTATCSHKWNWKVQFSWWKKPQINDVIWLLQYKSFLISLIALLNTYPAITDLIKVNSKHSRVSCATCTKLRIKTLRLKILFRAYNFVIKTIIKSLIIFKKPRRWLMISLITYL